MSSSGKDGLGNVAAFHSIFFEEADEHLSAMERLLLRMDEAAPSVEDLNAIFRAAHSIKGTSGMLGFTEISELTHVLENLLDLLRKMERPLTRSDVDTMLRAGDMVRMQVAYRRGASPDVPDMDGVLAELRALAETPQADGGGVRRFAVRLGPLEGPVDDDDVQIMLSGLAEMGSVSNEEIQNVAGGALCFDFEFTGAEADLRSVLALVVPESQIGLTRVTDAEPAPGIEEAAPEAEEADLQAEESAPEAGESAATGTDFEILNPTPSESRAASRPERRAPAEDSGLDLFVTPDSWRRRRQSDRSALVRGDASSIRVSVEKIDRLVNLVGELVITEAMLQQQKTGGDGDATSHESTGLRDLARHTRNLQEAVMSIRMVPISAVFSRFPRLVRELSQRLGKEVELKLEGEATELDRGLIEKITDPLTHLVRNAIDHGLELPEERAAAGKPRGGTLWLRASQRGSNILIELRDDGRGFDRKRIMERAAQQGRPIPDDAPDREVWQRVFEPGFSTAESVTDVSGRGVGMDVVRRNIRLLRGHVEVDSQAGKGSSVTVSVPLTLAIIEAMTVGVQGARYALPLASVIEVRQVGPQELRGIAGQGLTLRVRDDYLPVQHLGQGNIAIIVEADGSRTALIVDELIGQQQIVVKSLEANFRRMPGISGATIMGDGKVALIVDVAHVVSRASSESQLRH